MTPKTPTAKAPPPAAATPQDALALLSSDHREVEALFERYKALAGNASDSDRQALAETICDLLAVHATIEDEIFYPAARQSIAPSELLNEAEVEHGCVRDLIADIKAMEPDDELYNATVKVLGEYVAHHVREEEGSLFPQIAQSGLDLAELGGELAAMKQELMADIAELAQT